MAGNVARVAVERSGRLPCYKTIQLAAIAGLSGKSFLQPKP